MNTVFSTHELAVHYGRFEAIPGLTLECPAGAVGLLGPNGAGKSSLLKALLGLVKPSGGTVEVLGMSVRKQALEARRRVGYMPEAAVHFPRLTGFENVAYAGRISGMPSGEARRRAHEVLEFVGLGEARYRSADEYSQGMRQRVKLACALVHDPDLLLLDEPTNGLDPGGRTEILALIRDLSHTKGLSVLLSSHLLFDVESVCDHVMVLQQGRLRLQGGLTEVKGSLAGARVQLKVVGPVDELVEQLEGRGVAVFFPDEVERSSFMIRMPDGFAPVEVLRIAQALGCQVRRFVPREPTLEEIFLQSLTPGS